MVVGASVVVVGASVVVVGAVVVVVGAAVVVVGAAVVVVGASVVVVGAPVVVVAAVVVVGGEVVVLAQGSGEHVPGPRFEPPALEHCVAVSTRQVKAPPAEPGTQHWIGGSVVVVVVVGAPVLVLVEEVAVVLVEDVVVVDAAVVVVGASVVVVGVSVVEVVVGAVVVVLAQGSGEHVPGPRFAPPALEHCVAVSTRQVKAPPAEPGTQHWIGGSVVVVVGVTVVLVEVVLVLDVLLVVVVVVLATSGAHRMSTFLLPASVLTQAAPVNVMELPRPRRAFGAVMKARTLSLAARCTVSPPTLRSGVAASPVGPKVVSFSSRTLPCTLIVDWPVPETVMLACLPVRISQTL